jgi:ATP-dependent Lon protease
MLGDVMRESAQAAVSYVWSNADAFGIDPKLFEGKTIHVHVPAGAIPKDGPSAG